MMKHPIEQLLRPIEIPEESASLTTQCERKIAFISHTGPEDNGTPARGDAQLVSTGHNLSKPETSLFMRD